MEATLVTVPGDAGITATMRALSLDASDVGRARVTALHSGLVWPLPAFLF